MATSTVEAPPAEAVAAGVPPPAAPANVSAAAPGNVSAAAPGNASATTWANVSAAAPASASAPAAPNLRLVHAPLNGEDAGAPFRQAAEAGFTHVVISPPWVSGRQGNPYLVGDFDRLASGGNLSDLAGHARRSGTSLVLDVQIDRIAADNALLATPDTPFSAPERDALLDPRRSEGSDAAPARLGAGRGDVLALADWWGHRLAAWQADGVAGFRLLGLESLGGGVGAFCRALRAAVPRALLLAWTPGLPRADVLALAGLGMDGVFVSLPWWDWQADWLWDELASLLDVAPVLGVDGVPPGLHAVRRPGGDGQAGAGQAGLAATIGQGWIHVAAPEGPSAQAATLNTMLAGEPALAARHVPALPLGDAGPVLAVLRTDAPDSRSASRAALAVINGDAQRTLPVAGAALLTTTGGAFGPFRDAEGGAILSPATVLELPPGEMRLFVAEASGGAAPGGARALPEDARRAAAAPRLAIEQPTPCVDGGAFPVKAIAGELLAVQADVVFDGHDKIAAALRWHGPDGAWREVPMRPLGNDRWQADLPLAVLGRHSYVVTAWRDRWATFCDELGKKSAAGVPVRLEMQEGAALIEAAAARADGALRTALRDLLRVAGTDGLQADAPKTGTDPGRLATLLSPEAARLMAEADDRPHRVETAPIPVDAERIGARFASWYEVFPRSMSDDEGRHGTFADVERHLPRIAGMGFDVLYFPPISPIGRTNRKGRNNSLTPAPDDPGSPYAIGAEAGGHDALHPELGTLADFQSLRRAAAAHGLELAIDFAIQCSPDHPWLKQHPGWFDWRPDGTIRYAENPPKKYEDIVNVDFYAADAVPSLWTALCDVVLFWAEQGVRLFRVDNPHTKPLPFWHWMIATVRARFPDAIFLAEAFTRPKVMYRLAKVGFSQSYTYFTWRNTKRELEAYSTELDTEAPRDFFRPHFFVNTPDINPIFLQGSGRPGFLIRAAMAATLSGLWGVYNGFELCEAAAVPGKEEYLDSEKYQLRAWDWDRPGNIVAEITALNRIRRQNPALQTHRGVTFLTARNETVLFYEKATADRSNVVLVAVSLDPLQPQEADIELPLWRWKLPDDASLPVRDLLGGASFAWQGKYQRIRLTPEQPYAVWRVRAL